VLEGPKLEGGGARMLLVAEQTVSRAVNPVAALSLLLMRE